MAPMPKFDFGSPAKAISVINDIIHAGRAVIVNAEGLAPDMETMAAAYLAMYYARDNPDLSDISDSVL